MKIIIITVIIIAVVILGGRWYLHWLKKCYDRKQKQCREQETFIFDKLYQGENLSKTYDRLRNSAKKTIIVLSACILVLGCGAYFVDASYKQWSADFKQWKVERAERKAQAELQKQEEKRLEAERKALEARKRKEAEKLRAEQLKKQQDVKKPRDGIFQKQIKFVCSFPKKLKTDIKEHGIIYTLFEVCTFLYLMLLFLLFLLLILALPLYIIDCFRHYVNRGQ